MKYTKLFNNHEEYVAYTASTSFIRPNVSYCREDDESHCTPPDQRVIPYEEQYLTLEALSDGDIMWVCEGDAARTISYSINDNDWVSITSTSSGTPISVSSGDKVRLKGNNDQYATAKDVASMFSGGTATYNVYGNAMSLIGGDDFSGLTSFNDKIYVFHNLFNTSKAVSAKNLILPSLTLTNSCYRAMFAHASGLTEAPSVLPATTTSMSGCAYMFQETNITEAPELPATTLANNCYQGMFSGCKSLTTAPELTATTLAQNCYSNMFNGCRSLTTAPYLPATTLAQNCYDSMFFGCTSLTTAPSVLPATTLANKCYNSMFQNCTKLTTVPSVLPATTLASECYSSMFHRCTSLTTAPELPATTLAQSCYVNMFRECAITTAPVLPATTLANKCYNSMFFKCTSLTTAPSVLPATTLANNCYDAMFQGCSSLTTAPELPATTLVSSCYNAMFSGCTHLNYIKCLATNISVTSSTSNWVKSVAASGTFIKEASMTSWTEGINGIPSGWTVYNDTNVKSPIITFDGFNTIAITCETDGAVIYYKLNDAENYSVYSVPIEINEDTFIEAYAELDNIQSREVSLSCSYVSDVPIEYSNRDLKKWEYYGQEITTPYSVNRIDGHSSSYAKGEFTFETSFVLREAEPTYLWFQHADQSASIYVDNTLVEKHWGGYGAFTTDISEHVHSGVNNVKVILKNNEGDSLAPASGDFNFNATLGKVKLFTSPYIPSMTYGYDGFHITSTVSTASATINVKTSIPTGATVICTISGVNCNYTATSASTNNEMTFTTTISNPRLWNGKIDPYLYNVKLEIYHDNELYHRYERPYGLRFYEYVINDTVKYGTAQNPYTGFLLNGQPYLLRGVCMHDDLADKANALNDADYTQEFNIITELGCNFLRLAHYPHPKEVYDKCDELGIIVQTEVPCVNKLQSTMPSDYYTHLEGQYDDMVNQHYNHPCIMFWGLSNEAKVDNNTFAKTKIEGYVSQIKALDSERMVGLVCHAHTNPSAYFGDPTNIDWIGNNLYQGWYQNQDSNNPTSQINASISNTITRVGKAYALSEYGCGGTPTCHSDDFMTTTTRGNKPRHDIEYMMWLHEGHIAAIKNFPQLMFTSQWQLFDIAVAARNEGYTECLDGVNTSTNDALRRLNNKGLVERDHVTKKDPFYLYKAWWNPTPFIHICGKNYTKSSDRVIKCYTNVTSSLSLYVNNTLVESVTPSNNIAEFTATNFTSGDVIRVDGGTSTDTFTFQ